MTSTPVTLLVDADILAYRAASANTVEIEWAPDVWTYHADLTQAKEAFTRQLEPLMEAVGASKTILAVSSRTNFRKALYGPYKGNRGRKPPGYGAFRAWLIEEFPSTFPSTTSYERDGLEADDILGILGTDPDLIQGDRIIWSADKDLRQIPGVHLAGVQEDGSPDLRDVSETEGELRHVWQTLTGDNTDNYPGCPGIGPVKADKIIKPFLQAPWKDSARHVWAEVLKAYQKEGLTKEVMLVQARVARILRADDYDFDNKEPILWNPPF